jgi:hypothetical protein
MIKSLRPTKRISGSPNPCGEILLGTGINKSKLIENHLGPLTKSWRRCMLPEKIRLHLEGKKTNASWNSIDELDQIEGMNYFRTLIMEMINPRSKWSNWETRVK